MPKIEMSAAAPSPEKLSSRLSISPAGWMRYPGGSSIPSSRARIALVTRSVL